eukprot:gene27741-27108_t
MLRDAGVKIQHYFHLRNLTCPLDVPERAQSGQLCGNAATAQQRYSCSRRGQAKMVTAGDADGDGMVSLGEAIALGMDTATFNDIDADGNGQLTNAE